MSKNSEVLSQPAYTFVLDMILNRQLLPGTRISEAAIAEQFGISRTPVRDAMRQLANDGLIEIFPNRFAQVAEYSELQIREIGVLRLTLDQLAVRLAMVFGSKSDFFQLQKTAERCFEASKTGDLVEQHRQDCNFHMEMTQMTGNSLLMKFQNELYLRVLFILVNYPYAFNDQQAQIDEHFQIASALIAQDKETALTLVTRHLSSFYMLKDYCPEDLF